MLRKKCVVYSRVHLVLSWCHAWNGEHRVFFPRTCWLQHKAKDKINAMRMGCFGGCDTQVWGELRTFPALTVYFLTALSVSEHRENAAPFCRCRHEHRADTWLLVVGSRHLPVCLHIQILFQFWPHVIWRFHGLQGSTDAWHPDALDGMYLRVSSSLRDIWEKEEGSVCAVTS